MERRTTVRNDAIQTPKAESIMEEYFKTHRTDSYLDAYIARRTNNHHVLVEVAEKLKDAGAVCYTYRDDFVSGRCHLVYVLRDGKWTTVGFSEVPYRWYAGSPYSPTARLASWNSYAFPFSMSDIEDSFGSVSFTESMFNQDRSGYVRL